MFTNNPSAAIMSQLDMAERQTSILKGKKRNFIREEKDKKINEKIYDIGRHRSDITCKCKRSNLKSNITRNNPKKLKKRKQL